ncbi:MAG: single-stranded DNA-binding protein [Bulleidia sp.]
MAGGLNRVVLVGRLTKDVEVRKTPSGISMARFTVAVDRRFSSRNNAQQNNQPTADFISCIAWRQSADFLGSYGRKGTLVGVEGSIQTGSYTNQAGQKVYTTDVSADNVQLLESRSASSNRAESAPVYNEGIGDSYNEPAAEAPHAEFDTGPTLDISSDDLPF